MVLKITNLHILRYLPTCWLYLLECYTIDNQRCTHTASESRFCVGKQPTNNDTVLLKKHSFQSAFLSSNRLDWCERHPPNGLLPTTIINILFFIIRIKYIRASLFCLLFSKVHKSCGSEIGFGIYFQIIFLWRTSGKLLFF